MIKTVGLFERRDDLTRSAFRSHYEEEHAPLGASLLEFSGYARNYPSSDAATRELAVDGVSEFWFADAGALTQLGVRLAGDAGQQLAEDEERFMNRATNHSYEVSERLHGTRPSPGQALRGLAIVRLPAGARPGERERRLASDATRAAERALDGVIATLHSVPLRAMKPPPVGTPAIGCLESVWVRDADVLRRCNHLRAEGGATPLSLVDEFGDLPT